MVLLVHGVGNPYEGEILGAAHPNLEKAGIAHDRVEEYNWNRDVPKPYQGDRRRVSSVFLATLGEGFVGAARLPVLPAEAARSARARAITAVGIACEWTAMALPVVLVGWWLVEPTMLPAWSWVLLGVASVQLILATTFGSAAVLCANLRQVLLVVLWPGVFLGCVAGMIGWRILFVIACPLAFAEIGMGIGVLVAGSPIEQVPDGSGRSSLAWWALIPALVGSGVGWLVGSAIVERSSAPVRTVIETVLKVIADVVKYLGAPRYRKALVDGLARRADAYANTPLILATHSLGTVIGFDHIRGLRARKASEPMRWITAGSPLHRWIHRFFPYQYPAPAHFQQRLRREQPAIEWINVYRRLDIIGKGLGLGNGRDRPTRQWKGHANYWGDERVYKAIAKPATHQDRVPEEPTLGPYLHRPDWGGPPPSRRHWQARTLLGALVAIVVWFCIDDHWLEARRAPARVAWLLEHGVEVEGTASYRERLHQPKYGNRRVVKLFWVRFEPDGPLPGRSTSPPERLVREHDLLEETLRHPLTDESGESVRSMDIVVRYDPEDPRSFTVPGFERTEPYRLGAAARASTTWAVVFLAGMAMALRSGAWRVWGALSGVGLNEDPTHPAPTHEPPCGPRA